MAENVAATKPQKVAPTSQTLREYETIYLLRQDLTPEQVDRIKERLRGIIDRTGGRVIKFTTWGRKKTAFPVGNKEGRAIYVHVAYLGQGGLVQEVERNLRNFEEVLKFQTVKVSDAVLPESRPTEEDVVLEGDREEERPAREARDEAEGDEGSDASDMDDETQEAEDSEEESDD
jgi:small subunit ribosomal protein S6